MTAAVVVTLSFRKTHFFPKTYTNARPSYYSKLHYFLLSFLRIFFTVFPPSNCCRRIAPGGKPLTVVGSGTKGLLQQAPETPGESDVVALFVTREQHYRGNAPLHERVVCAFFNHS